MNAQREKREGRLSFRTQLSVQEGRHSSWGGNAQRKKGKGPGSGSIYRTESPEAVCLGKTNADIGVGLTRLIRQRPG